jgi:hypothetical protein
MEGGVTAVLDALAVHVAEAGRLGARDAHRVWHLRWPYAARHKRQRAKRLGCRDRRRRLRRRVSGGPRRPSTCGRTNLARACEQSAALGSRRCGATGATRSVARPTSRGAQPPGSALQTASHGTEQRDVWLGRRVTGLARQDTLSREFVESCCDVPVVTHKDFA